MILAIDKLSEARLLNPGKKVVLTSGTYDLFHVGHLHYLQAAKALGDVLVVMLSGDSRVRSRKGLKRPIIPEAERLEILDALKCTDYVFVDPGTGDSPETNPAYLRILNALQPDIYATDGEDVRFSKIIAKEKYVILPRVEGGYYGSTSAIIKHVASLSGGD